MGIAALVLGIIAFVLAVTFVLAPLGVVLAVIGLILGIVDTVKKGKSGEKKAISMAGMILSAVMFVTLMVESFFILIVGIAVYDSVSNYDGIPIEIESITVDSFNAKFSSYEGTITGTKVKVLLSNIATNNAQIDKDIDVYYDGIEEEPYTLRQEILTTRKYTVTFYKDIDGYIHRVYIMPNYNDTINNNQL